MKNFISIHEANESATIQDGYESIIAIIALSIPSIVQHFWW